MKKGIIILVLVFVIAFAAGLRIDFKALADRMQNKSDPNAESLVKMGIDPSLAGFKPKPWWTFRSEDNLFKRLDLGKWNPIKTMSDDSQNNVLDLKKKLGPGPMETLLTQGQSAAAQARLAQQRMEKNIRAAEEEARPR